VYPSDPFSVLNLGRVISSKKQYDRAERPGRPCRTPPPDPSLYYMKAVYAQSSAAPGPCRKQLIKSALKLDHRAEYLDFLAWCCMRMAERRSIDPI